MHCPFHAPSSSGTEEDSLCNTFSMHHPPFALPSSCTALSLHQSPHIPMHHRGFQAQFCPSAVFSVHHPPPAQSSPDTGENSTSHLLHAPSSSLTVLPLQLPLHRLFHAPSSPCTILPLHPSACCIGASLPPAALQQSQSPGQEGCMANPALSSAAPNLSVLQHPEGSRDVLRASVTTQPSQSCLL